jgi:hypothetical protein
MLCCREHRKIREGFVTIGQCSDLFYLFPTSSFELPSKQELGWPPTVAFISPTIVRLDLVQVALLPPELSSFWPMPLARCCPLRVTALYRYKVTKAEWTLRGLRQRRPSVFGDLDIPRQPQEVC